MLTFHTNPQHLIKALGEQDAMQQVTLEKVLCCMRVRFLSFALTPDDVVKLPDCLANKCRLAAYGKQFLFNVSHHVRFPRLC